MTGPTFDIRRFTLRELEAVERAAGVPLDKFGSAPSRARLIAALVWQQRLRTDPKATLDDVLDMDMEAMTKELGVADSGDADPTGAGSGT